MSSQEFVFISGMENGQRVDSRILEERLQQAVAKGHRYIQVGAYGQHGIGGRLWKAGQEPVYVRVRGFPGQRLGSMGFPNTRIEVMGPVSDDVGWLNAGAEIIVHGNAANGAANAMAQGKIYVAGNIGARGMTMTKHNPRFEPPELWVLGCVGDYFAEFMAFFFPQAHAGIDWSRGHEFLDKKLQQVVRDAELGRRRADKLVKVWRKNGDEAWVLVHVEVQAWEEAAFAERMYVYNYRLFDRYRRRVASLAVLGDEREGWRPNRFGYELWGCG